MNDFLIYSIFLAISLLLVLKSGSVYPLVYLFLFTYFIQYIFASYLVYNRYKELAIEMDVNQVKFFGYMAPAFISLFLGVFILNRDIQLKSILDKIDKREASHLGYFLLLISLAFDFSGLAALQSINSFTFYLRYIAVFCFLFSDTKMRYFIIAAVYLSLIYRSFNSGFFMDLIIWMIYFFFMLSLRFNFSLVVRMCFVLTSLLFLFLMQSVKSEYRSAVWSHRKKPGIRTYMELTFERNKKAAEKSLVKSKGFVNTIHRLNQGWHIAKILKTVPNKVPFSNGQEMLGDIIGSVTPRIFFSNKKAIHTNEKFRKYTGHKLDLSTVMTIGIIGDFYVNFGRNGSFILLFVFGGLISIFLKFFIKRHVLNDPINLVWLPFLFSYLVRADNDFYAFSNGFMKGYLIFIVVNYVRKIVRHRYSVIG